MVNFHQRKNVQLTIKMAQYAASSRFSFQYTVECFLQR